MAKPAVSNFFETQVALNSFSTRFVTRKWVRARYRAELREIEARYAEWEIISAPEVRDVDANAHAFSPHRQPIGNLGPVLEAVEWRWRHPRHFVIAGVAT